MNRNAVGRKETQRSLALVQLQGLIIQGRGRAAQERARQILASFPNDPDVRLLLASSLAAQGRKVDAMLEAETALRQAPQNINILHMLGLLYVELKLFELALPLLQRALKLNSQSHLIHWASAIYHLTLGKGQLALSHAETALGLARSDADRAAIQRTMFDCCLSLGRLDQAQAHFETLKSIPAHKFDGLQKLALARNDGLASTLGAEIDAALRLPDLPTVLRSNLLLARGRLLENDKRYDDAFNAWHESRSLLGVSHFNAGGMLSAVALRKAFYTTELFTNIASKGCDSNFPIFVVGMPRSGTTLVEQLIAAHPDADGVGELERLDQTEPSFIQTYGQPDGLRRLEENAEKNELRARGFELHTLLTGIARAGVKRIVEKTPYNYMFLGYLALCLPNAKFIHCRRHPADIFISSYQNPMSREHDYTYSQDAFAQAYAIEETYMAHWKRVLPGRVREVVYEDLATDFENGARKIIDFIDLPWSDACLKFYQTGRTVNTFSSQQVRQSVHSGSVGRWKKYHAHLNMLHDSLSELGHGYDNEI